MTKEQTVEYKLMVRLYNCIKEDIKLAVPRWGTTTDTFITGKGHCGVKSELLVKLLRDVGIKARYIESRNTGMRNLLVSGILIKLGFTLFDAHIYVEANINDEWIALDTTPDSGIVHFTGDTKVGTHLGAQNYRVEWDDLPFWYKDVYNCCLLSPLRVMANLELNIRRLLGSRKMIKEDRTNGKV